MLLQIMCTSCVPPPHAHPGKTPDGTTCLHTHVPLCLWLCAGLSAFYGPCRFRSPRRSFSARLCRTGCWTWPRLGTVSRRVGEAPLWDCFARSVPCVGGGGGGDQVRRVAHHCVSDFHCCRVLHHQFAGHCAHFFRLEWYTSRQAYHPSIISSCSPPQLLRVAPWPPTRGWSNICRSNGGSAEVHPGQISPVLCKRFSNSQLKFCLLETR